MKRLLQETCKKVSDNDDKKLSNTAYINVQKRYRNNKHGSPFQSPVLLVLLIPDIGTSAPKQYGIHNTILHEIIV